MLVKNVMNDTSDKRLFDFFNNSLPTLIFTDDSIRTNGIDITGILEEKIRSSWVDFCNKNGYQDELSQDFNFIYTIRRRLNRQKNLNSSIFFVKIPTQKHYDGDAPISGGILISENGRAKVFGLKELSKDLVPGRFIKNNQNYLLYEIDEHLEVINWGALMNPRNFSELSESIFLISEV